MIVRVESRETFEMVYRHLKEGDTLIISTVKILGNSKEQALIRCMQLFVNGVVIYSIQEPYSNKIQVLLLSANEQRVVT